LSRAARAVKIDSVMLSHRAAVVAMLVATLSLLAALPSCRGPRPAADAEPAIPIGRSFYTQFALQFEKGRFRTTNYRRGELLPINTEVQVVESNARETVVRVVGSDLQLTIENMPRHTSETMAEAIPKILADAPVDLREFSEQELEAIERGEVEEGMSRDAVIAAIGYPPASGTSSLDSKQWKYWETRWNTFVVSFDADWVVREIRR